MAFVGVSATGAGLLLVALFGPTFRPAAGPFRIPAAGLALVSVAWVPHATAISMSRGSLLLTAGLVGLAANVALNASLIPPLGARGGAFAVIVCEGIGVAVLAVPLFRTSDRVSAADAGCS